jgi:hypothetical protein
MVGSKGAFVWILFVLLFAGFFLFQAFTLTQAQDMDKIVQHFEKVDHYAEEHCEDSYLGIEECMDRQFNCFVEMDSVFVSQGVVQKAKRAGTEYDRKGNVETMDFCEIKRKARLYHAQEQVQEAQERIR